MRRKTKRHLKKYLRQREKELNKHLSRFLNDFDLTRSFDDEENFKPLLKIRWQIYELIYIRLKLHPRWIGKQWFLDLLDVDNLKIENNSVWFTGDIVWWAEGKDAVGEWYPADHEPQKTRPYKEKIRGNLDGGLLDFRALERKVS